MYQVLMSKYKYERSGVYSKEIQGQPLHVLCTDPYSVYRSKYPPLLLNISPIDRGSPSRMAWIGKETTVSTGNSDLRTIVQTEDVGWYDARHKHAYLNLLRSTTYFPGRLWTALPRRLGTLVAAPDRFRSPASEARQSSSAAICRSATPAPVYLVACLPEARAVQDRHRVAHHARRGLPEYPSNPPTPRRGDAVTGVEAGGMLGSSVAWQEGREGDRKYVNATLPNLLKKNY
ncbi:uncharacterized protein RSE6_09291 [Rhynchosporium secalis]|uniref:Uncharacterized protein n=1 Tax=Rhynchosporium secalis TaxID=38038 RepID=A0A1E1MHM6_RHYSE|nr:uncharacterized protein RSE6_09291 [Rhynchosporium secalis]